MDLVLNVGMDVRRRRVAWAFRKGERLMELALQFGWGMMTHSRILLDEWNGGTVILSPRDLNDDQLTRLSHDVTGLGGRSIVDPQFYLPHSDHQRLCSHAYWPREFEPEHRLLPAEWETLLNNLDGLNDELGTAEFLLPGILAGSADYLDVWLDQHETMLGEAQRLGLLDKWSCWATVAVGADVATQADSCQRIVEWLERWSVDGVYLVIERPGALCTWP